VVNGLRSVITDDLIQVQDTIELLSSTDDATAGLNAFFTFVAVLCAILIFFAAWLSFDANVRYGSPLHLV
jgi:succinate dehydrogenase hydrophobic anchor subunit